jgi:hypothetical protein
MPPTRVASSAARCSFASARIGCSIAARGRVPRDHPFFGVEPYDDQKPGVNVRKRLRITPSSEPLARTRGVALGDSLLPDTRTASVDRSQRWRRAASRHGTYDWRLGARFRLGGAKLADVHGRSSGSYSPSRGPSWGPNARRRLGWPSMCGHPERGRGIRRARNAARRRAPAGIDEATNPHRRPSPVGDGWIVWSSASRGRGSVASSVPVPAPGVACAVRSRRGAPRRRRTRCRTRGRCSRSVGVGD